VGAGGRFRHGGAEYDVKNSGGLRRVIQRLKEADVFGGSGISMRGQLCFFFYRCRLVRGGGGSGGSGDLKAAREKRGARKLRSLGAGVHDSGSDGLDDWFEGADEARENVAMIPGHKEWAGRWRLFQEGTVLKIFRERRLPDSGLLAGGVSESTCHWE